MTRSSVLTSNFVLDNAGTSVVDAGRSPSSAIGRGTVRRAAPVRRPAGSRPDGGTIEYGLRGSGVSQVEHEERSRLGFAQMCAVAVTTAVLALGLIGIANLRADDAGGAAPTSTSIVQSEAGVAGGR